MIEPWPQRWEARVLPLCHHGPKINLVIRAENTTMKVEATDFKQLFEAH